MYYNKELKPLNPEEVDLEKGYTYEFKNVKADATPIDNITKFAWDDEDFEIINIYVPYEAEEFIRTDDDDRDSMIVDMEYRLTMLELGI